MVDIPESSERNDTEETRTTEESMNMVDTVDNSTLDWIGAEPRGIASIYSFSSRQAYTIIEYGGGQEGFRRNFKIIRPTRDARICSEFTQDAFTMYEIIFKYLRLRFSLNDFQVGVFHHLNLAPSQLHPNAIAFLRAFKLTCRFLRIRATIPLFFRVFHL